MPLSLDHLAVLERVVTCQSMSRAAESLSVTQPAVSKTIRAMERSLSVRVFDRTRGALRLTPAGRVLASYAKRIVDTATAAERAMADLASLRRGELSLVATPTLSTYVLPDALVHMRRRFPGIEVRVETGSVRAAGARVRDGLADFALVDAVPDADGLASRVFAQESLVVIAPPRHPRVRRKKPLDLDELSALPFIVRELGSNARSFAELALANHGVALRPTLTLASTEAIKRAVASGLGFAIVPAFAVRAELAMRTLAELSVARLMLRRPLYVTTPSGVADGKPAIAFLCLLKHALRGSLPKLPADVGRRPA